jgi:hypothetical protein
MHFSPNITSQKTVTRLSCNPDLPTVSKLCAIGTTPVDEITPCEGRNPKMPQNDAGHLTLPPVSVPEVNPIRGGRRDIKTEVKSPRSRFDLL